MGGPGPAAGREAPRSGARPGSGRRHSRPGNHPGVPAARPLLILGHSSASQRSTAAWSRSAALRRGRCKLQPNRPVRIRHTCTGWWRTPVSRQITSATRSSVHRLLANPWAPAPWSKACSTWSSCVGNSLRCRPIGPRARNAWTPPARQARYQRCALWRETPSRSATAAADTPWTNRLAAASRRRSKTDCWGRSFGSRDNVRRLVLMPRASHPTPSPVTPEGRNG
jgi:hypothetical protein